MYIIVGLGNPEEKYDNTRHNTGFMMLDWIAGDIFSYDKYSNADIGRMTLGNESVLLAKPKTYMNRSGEAVRVLVEKNNTTPEKVIVVYDDVALPLGTFKIAYERGDGGHNGIKSIAQHLKTKGFIRIRVGVGATTLSAKLEEKFKSRANYVLSRFSKKELSLLKECSHSIESALRAIVEQSYKSAMDSFN